MSTKFSHIAICLYLGGLCLLAIYVLSLKGSYLPPKASDTSDLNNLTYSHHYSAESKKAFLLQDHFLTFDLQEVIQTQQGLEQLALQIAISALDDSESNPVKLSSIISLHNTQVALVFKPYFYKPERSTLLFKDSVITLPSSEITIPVGPPPQA